MSLKSRWDESVARFKEELTIPSPPIIPHQDRIWGIDALRICSMILIVFAHVCGTCKFSAFGNKPIFAPGAMLWQWLYVLSFCGVNCFGMISGYVGFRNRFRLSRIATYIFQVVFTYFFFALLFSILSKEPIELDPLLKGFWNILAPQSESVHGILNYWYASAYLMVLVFQPFLNILVQSINRRQHELLLLAIVILQCSFFGNMFFLTFNGRSGIWLISLYLFGAYVGRYSDKLPWKRWHCALAVFGSVLLHWLIIGFGVKLPLDVDSISFILSLLIAYGQLIFFSKTDFKKRTSLALIKFFGPATFGVYLIHMHPVVKPFLIPRRFRPWFHGLPDLAQPIALVAISVGVFIVCALAERIRLFLFGLFSTKKKNA